MTSPAGSARGDPGQSPGLLSGGSCGGAGLEKGFWGADCLILHQNHSCQGSAWPLAPVLIPNASPRAHGTSLGLRQVVSSPCLGCHVGRADYTMGWWPGQVLPLTPGHHVLAY